MGIVYEAETPGGDRLALKLIEAEIDERSRRFLHEVATLLRARHSSVLRLLDYGWTVGSTGESVAFLATERLEGRTLLERMSAGRLSRRESFLVVECLASALSSVHAVGVVHRDIKPANVVCCDDGRVVLIDFGIALGSALTRLTKLGRIVGSLPYMAPERLLDLEPTPASDIFSLGVLLFELLEGRRPFEGADTNALLASIRKGPTWSTTSSANDRALIERLLANDPDRRPTAGELAKTCAGFAKNRRSPRISLMSAVGGTALGMAAGWAQTGAGSHEPRPVAASAPAVTVEEQPLETHRLLQMSHSESFQIGDQALRRGQLDLAVKALTRATELNPAHADSHRRLGDALMASGDLESAARSYRILTALRPSAQTEGMSQFLSETARGR